MTADRLTTLAAELDVGLHSPGLCLACLSFVAFADAGDERAVRREVTQIAPGMWDDGFGVAVRHALAAAAARGVHGAASALRDLDERRWRSAIFRAVIRRLSVELRDDARRRYHASLN
ncbi:MAG TPA: hypothetical protein VFA56_06085 [Gaiellaceae bacterium]|nr:hypothetical protein [Gaiellaceae bacterium]